MRYTANINVTFLFIELWLKGNSSEFSKVAKIVETPEYYADKKKYKSLGTKEYDEWFEKSHTWINGKPSPVSYYKMLVPKDT